VKARIFVLALFAVAFSGLLHAQTPEVVPIGQEAVATLKVAGFAGSMRPTLKRRIGDYQTLGSTFETFRPSSRRNIVTAFDTVHDQAKPAALLGHVAAALKRGGTFLMWDVAASSDLHNNRDHLLGPFLYAVSCMHCMTVSLSQNGEGLGAMWGQERAKQMLATAGLVGTQVHRIDEDPVNCCYVATKA
jgi:hypothetical protein